MSGCFSRNQRNRGGHRPPLQGEFNSFTHSKAGVCGGCSLGPLATGPQGVDRSRFVELPPIVDTAAKDVFMQGSSVRPAIRGVSVGGRKGGEVGGGRCYPSKIRIEILALHGKMAGESVL